MRLWRAHGLGNDYLVVEEGSELDPGLARALCDRHRGVGADGLLEPRPSERAQVGLRIWNPDGSVAEKSGNGLRIYADWLWRTRGERRWSVETGAEVVACEVGSGEVRVEMGRGRLLDDPPVHRLEVEGASLPVVAIRLGNPHAVVFVEDPDALPWRRWGAALEHHPHFPDRTNVQVASVGAEGLHARIWERGAGETMASGSSACAVVFAAVHTRGLSRGVHRVYMEGGSLRVEIDAQDRLVLGGPVEAVGRVAIDPGWLAARRGR